VGERTQPALSTLQDRVRAAMPALIGLLLFVAALEVLRTELRTISWHGLIANVSSIPAQRIVLALLLTAANYAVLTGYDFLAFMYIGRRPQWRRVVMTSFLAYAISNNVGFAMLSGAAVRYRLYTRWGITAEELSRVVFSYVVTFWLGLLLIGGLSLAIGPLTRGFGVSAPAILAPVGWLLMFASVGYVAAAGLRLGPIRFRRMELPLPSPRIAIAQLGISILEWTIAGAVLYVLIPAGSVPFLAFLGAFVACQLLGLVSHVPGGVGVFEGLMVLLLKPYIPSTALLPVLIAYRAVYYLLPLSVAALALVADELRQRRSQAARLTATLGWLTEQLTPRVLAIFTFLSGVFARNRLPTSTYASQVGNRADTASRSVGSPAALNRSCR